MKLVKIFVFLFMADLAFAKWSHHLNGCNEYQFGFFGISEVDPGYYNFFLSLDAKEGEFRFIDGELGFDCNEKIAYVRPSEVWIALNADGELKIERLYTAPPMGHSHRLFVISNAAFPSYTRILCSFRVSAISSFLERYGSRFSIEDEFPIQFALKTYVDSGTKGELRFGGYVFSARVWLLKRKEGFDVSSVEMGGEKMGLDAFSSLFDW